MWNNSENITANAECFFFIVLLAREPVCCKRGSRRIIDIERFILTQNTIDDFGCITHVTINDVFIIISLASCHMELIIPRK